MVLVRYMQDKKLLPVLAETDLEKLYDLMMNSPMVQPRTNLTVN